MRRNFKVKEVGVVVFRANAIKKYLPVLVGPRGVGRVGCCRGSRGGGLGGLGGLGVLFVL